MACKKEVFKNYTDNLNRDCTSEDIQEKCNEQFKKNLTSVLQGYYKLGKEIERTRMLLKSWDPEAAYSYALHIHEESEKITMIARRLPCYLGMREAEERVRSEMEKIVPVEIGYTEEGWFCIRMFALLPRKEHGNVNYIRQCLYYEMRKFFEGKIRGFQKNCVLIYRHVYHNGFPERQMRDHDNIEINMVTDIVATYVLCDDGPSVCRHYYCSAKGQEDRCEVYVVPQTEFEKWLSEEKDMPDEGVKIFPEPPKKV